MNTIELYFVVVTKDGQVLFAESGPHFSWETASEAIVEEKISTRCYREVAKATLPCEVIE